MLCLWWPRQGTSVAVVVQSQYSITCIALLCCCRSAMPSLRDWILSYVTTTTRTTMKKKKRRFFIFFINFFFLLFNRVEVVKEFLVVVVVIIFLFYYCIIRLHFNIRYYCMHYHYHIYIILITSLSSTQKKNVTPTWAYVSFTIAALLLGHEHSVSNRYRHTKD